ncbi:alpha-amylase family protein [Pseudomonas aeruginosa]|uniref:alpha-amylase family protein n=1 Tax=Pseudomonas aeruginosa TaxID=287 RepID=UPI000F51DA36|nr:alpha-amylase family protein [Pseudomonas aeruginosa]MBG5303391.1 alpha-amylase family protein [Pseudomonas aeruginosa]MDA3275745.1 alpha-amylase family protein [Pseudomonas aeruginosa]MDI3650982.1 alpha-amylase family protein [Pseudomonas aeruginosa]MDI3796243.1 alpha-amylase family protein [Pseudomonas aeruginosa]QBL17456.1 glycosidase [Pseudomonas aeruginosa]
MDAEWFRHCLIYQIDPSLFRDSDADGCGDLGGIVERLDYLRDLGVGALWLMPLYRSPFRDAGYDVSDHLALDPRFGSEEDLRRLVSEAGARGMRVILELVVQHTSDQHPWFVSARHDREAPCRDYYLWADRPHEDGNRPIFPSVEDSIWSWDAQAGQYYRHLFYSHEPDLDLKNLRVIEEIERIMSHWLDLGVAGFRLDAASHLVEQAGGGDERHGAWLLERLARHAPQALLMGEVDVEPERYRHYFGRGDGDGRRLGLVLDFWINNHLFLALARQDAAPLRHALVRQPVPAPGCGYALWLRNHDELDLERLSDAEREEVMRAFAPEEDMRLYGRGIRRRLAPMLGGDPRRQAMAYALLLSLPGTPILRYGEEIGMGDDLRRPERLAVRTPMQWSAEPNGGFSDAPVERLVVAPIDDGPFACSRVSVAAQEKAPDSLLTRVRRLSRLRAELPETGLGQASLVPSDQPALFAIRHDLGQAPGSLMLVNLAERPVLANLGEPDLVAYREILADGDYPAPQGTRVALSGYGYRWFRRAGSDP